MPGRMRARLCLLVLVVAVPAALWALLPVGSTAESPGSIQNRIDHKEAQIGAKRRHEQVLTSDISAYTSRIDSLEGNISRLAARQAKLQNNLDAERAQLAAVQQKLRAERLRLTRLRAKLLLSRQILARRLVQVYETGQPDLVAVVLDSNGFADLLERTEFMSRISHQDTQIIDAVVTAKAEATASAERLGRLEKKETQVTAQIQSRRDQVANVKVGLQGTRDKLAGYRS
jgi:peptidoglycan DL-endopeptidase CwlO